MRRSPKPKPKPHPPNRIAINHNEYEAKHIGRTSDGRQFFLTTPFEPASGGQPGCEFVALFLFGADGELVEATIESFGPRATCDEVGRREYYDSLLRGLGDAAFGRIEVAPFSVERFGTTFGLILRELDDEDDIPVMELQPGNYMAFFEPWDSGDYDT